PLPAAPRCRRRIRDRRETRPAAARPCRRRVRPQEARLRRCVHNCLRPNPWPTERKLPGMAKKEATVDDRTVTKDELKQVQRANESGKQPVVFVHGLWLLPSSWDRWARLFEGAGYCAV